MHGDRERNKKLPKEVLETDLYLKQKQCLAGERVAHNACRQEMKSRLRIALQDSFNTADADSDDEDSDEESAEIEEEEDEEDEVEKGNGAEDEAYMKRLDREAAKISVSALYPNIKAEKEGIDTGQAENITLGSWGFPSLKRHAVFQASWQA